MMNDKLKTHFENLALNTEEVLEAKYRDLDKKVDATDRLRRPGPFYALGIIVLFFVGMITLAELDLVQYQLHLLVVIFFMVLAWTFLLVYGDYLTERRAELKPLATTPDLCSRSLELTEADDDARAWRDAAVAQGRQLRGFDFMMMKALHQPKLDEYKRRKAQERSQQELEESRRVCAALHTIKT